MFKIIITQQDALYGLQNPDQKHEYNWREVGCDCSYRHFRNKKWNVRKANESTGIRSRRKDIVDVYIPSRSV
jgi:hypothetical protein